MTNHDQQLDFLFKALADATRRQVVAQLAHGPESVSRLAQPFDMALPSFMQHIKILEDSGAIQTRKQGRQRICSLNKASIAEAELWINALRKANQARLDRLGDYLKDWPEDSR